jgi:hypothetical protein
VQRTLLAAVAPRVLACLMATFMAFVSLPALGADANVERQAQALQKKAIEEDNLNVNYPEAIKKLALAISKCDGDKCNATLKGALYRDLGAMLILSGAVDDGRASFGKALGLDPSLELDAAYKSQMLDGLWNDARKKAGGGGGAAPAGGAAAPDTGVATEGGGAPQPQGDFAHVPAGAQLVRTPLPVYAEYLGTEKLLRVVVKYRGAGMTDWKPFELRKMETGYGGLIPCKDVGEGRMQYYIQGYGTSDDPVAASGSRTKPYTVPIKPALSGPAPSLPGQDAPLQCAQSTGSSDCPPDFPGCRAAKKTGGEDCSKNSECDSGSCAGGKCAEKKGEGDDCDKDNECASGSCSDSKCTAPKKSADESCDSDDQCTSGVCKHDKCAEGADKRSSLAKARRMWIGVAGSLDFVSLPAADNVCKLVQGMNGGVSPVNTAGYQCVDPSTSANFPGTSLANNNRITAGTVAGGIAPGNLRLMVSFDYALSMNVLLGARAGYSLFTDPASAPGPAFAPIHVEARATFLVGKDALANSVAPMLLVAAGIGEFDASIGVPVTLTNPAGTRTENAWVTAGPFFAAAGAGLRFLLTPTVAATVAVKGEGAFGGSAGFLGGFAPEVGVQLGL